MNKVRLCQIEGCAKPHSSKGMCNTHYQRFIKGRDLLTAGPRNGERLEWVKSNLSYVGDDCLVWPYPRNKNGYGYVRFNGKLIPASRAMCILLHGEPPISNYQAAHSCGMGHEGCLNPRHLRWASPKENSADKVLHGTSLRGQSHPSSKLTDAEVLQIRHSQGRPADIAKKFGISYASVYRIKRPGHWSSGL
jgi:hypothetical protein